MISITSWAATHASSYTVVQTQVQLRIQSADNRCSTSKHVRCMFERPVERWCHLCNGGVICITHLIIILCVLLSREWVSEHPSIPYHNEISSIPPPPGIISYHIISNGTEQNPIHTCETQRRVKSREVKRRRGEKGFAFEVRIYRGFIYFPQLEHEQLVPQLQLEAPEHPHSPFMMMMVLIVGGVDWSVYVCVVCDLSFLICFPEFAIDLIWWSRMREGRGNGKAFISIIVATYLNHATNHRRAACVVCAVLAGRSLCCAGLRGLCGWRWGD